jgi:hypothetical protein
MTDDPSPDDTLETPPPWVPSPLDELLWRAFEVEEDEE